MSFADLLSGPKLYLICWFSYFKDSISFSPITEWLQVDLSAVSLFCLTEVIPLRLHSFCSLAFSPEVTWVTSTSIAVCNTLQESFMRARCYERHQYTHCGLSGLLQHSEASTLNPLPFDVLSLGFLFPSFMFMQSKVQKEMEQKVGVYCVGFIRVFCRTLCGGGGVQGRASRGLSKIPQPDD